MTPGIEEVTIDDLLNAASERKLSPRDTAAAVRRWQNESRSYLRDKAPDDDIYFRALDEITTPADAALGKLREGAVKEWQSTRFKELLPEPEKQAEFTRWAAQGIPDEDTLRSKMDSQVAKAFRDLRGVVQSEEFQPVILSKNNSIDSSAGNQIARWDAINKEGGNLEISVRLPDDPKAYTVELPKITEEDRKKALSAANAKYTSLIEEARTTERLGSSAFGGRREKATIERELSTVESEIELLERGLRASTGYLLQNRLTSELKREGNPLREKIGNDNLFEDFVSGLATGSLKLATGITDLADQAINAVYVGVGPGRSGQPLDLLSGVTSDLRDAEAAVRKALSGSTGREFREETFFSDLARAGGELIPAVIPAARIERLADLSAAARTIGGAAAGAGVQSYGATYIDYLNDADAAEAAGDKKLAATLRENARTAATLNGVTEMATEMLFPEQKLLGKSVGGFVSRASKEAVKSALQNSVEESIAGVLQGVFINPALQGTERSSAADIGEAALAGAALGGPLGVVSSINRPPTQVQADAQERLAELTPAVTEIETRIANLQKIADGKTQGVTEQDDIEGAKAEIAEQQKLLELTTARRDFWAKQAASRAAITEPAETAENAAGAVLISTMPEGTPIEEIRRMAQEATNNKPQQTDATPEREIPQGDQRQYQEAPQAGAPTAETGDSNRTVESGQVQPEVEETPPVTPPAAPDFAAQVEELNRLRPETTQLRVTEAPTGRFRQMAEQIKTLFGRDVVFVEGAARFDGLQRGNTLFIRTNGGQALNYVIGEELGHSLEGTPEYTTLVEALKERNPEEFARYRDVLVNDLQYRPEQIESEFVANVIGEAVADRAFWRRIAQSTDPTLLQRIYDKIATVIDKLLELARGQVGARPEASRAVVNLERARENVREFLQGVRQSPVTEASTEPRYSFAGTQAEIPQFMRDSLETAQSMAAAGKPTEVIRQITGWFPGRYDKKLRWEIPDENFLVRADVISDLLSGRINGTTLGELVTHPELFAAYPDISNLPVVIADTGGAIAQFTTLATGVFAIRLNRQTWNASSLLHEIQHWIQEREGFARGANPEEFSADYARLGEIGARANSLRKMAASEIVGKLLDASNSGDTKTLLVLRKDYPDEYKQVNELAKSFGRVPTREELNVEAERLWTEVDNATPIEMYRRTAGEIEARDVQARRKFTPEERGSVAPYSSENIAEEDAIVMFSTPAGSAESRSLTSVQQSDAEYLAAVERGDMETAQRMVDEAAKIHLKKSEADMGDYGEGYGGSVYHVIKELIKEYGISPREICNGNCDNFADDLATAIGGNVIATDEDFIGPSHYWVRKEGMNYDAETPKGVEDASDLSLFRRWRKSADPVTYDDQGNVIPLSQRFQESSDDIRFSRSRRGAGLPLIDSVRHRRVSTGAEYEVTEWKDLDAVVLPIMEAERATVGNAKEVIRLMQALQSNERRITDQLTRGIDRQFGARFRRMQQDYPVESLYREAANRERDVLRALVKQRMIAAAGNIGVALFRRKGAESARIGKQLLLEAQKAALLTKSEITASPHAAARLLQSVGHGWGDDLAETLANLYKGKRDFLRKQTGLTPNEEQTLEQALKPTAQVVVDTAMAATPEGRRITQLKGKVMSAMRSLYKKIVGQESASRGGTAAELLAQLRALEQDYNANIDMYLEMLADAVDNLSPANRESAIKALQDAAELDSDLMAEEKKLMDKDNDFARAAERFIGRISDTSIRKKTKKGPSEGAQSVAALRQAAIEGKITPEEAGNAFVYLGGAETRRAAFIDAITTEVGRLADRQASVDAQEVKKTADLSKLTGDKLVAAVGKEVARQEDFQRRIETILRERERAEAAERAQEVREIGEEVAQSEDFQRLLEVKAREAEEAARKASEELVKAIGEEEARAESFQEALNEQARKAAEQEEKFAKRVEATAQKAQDAYDRFLKTITKVTEDSAERAPQAPSARTLASQFASGSAAVTAGAVKQALLDGGLSEADADQAMEALWDAREFEITSRENAREEAAAQRAQERYDRFLQSIAKITEPPAERTAKPPSTRSLAAQFAAGSTTVTAGAVEQSLLDAGMSAEDAATAMEALWDAREAVAASREAKREAAVVKKQNSAVKAVVRSANTAAERAVARAEGRVTTRRPADRTDAQKAAAEARKVTSRFAAGKPDVSESAVREALEKAGVQAAEIDTTMDTLWDARLKVAEAARDKDDADSRDLARRVFESGASAVPGGRKLSVTDDIIQTLIDNPAWEVSNLEDKHKIVMEVLTRRGFTPEQAKANADAAMAAFESRMAEIAQRAVQGFAKKLRRGKVTDAELQRIIRLGIIDPLNGMADMLAELYGWKGLTEAEFDKVVELTDKAKSAIDPQVRLALNLQAMELVMAATGIPPSFRMQVSANTRASAYGGAGSLFLQITAGILNPVIAWGRELSNRIISTDSLRNPLSVLQAIAETSTDMAKGFRKAYNSAKIAWSTGAGLFLPASADSLAKVEQGVLAVEALTQRINLAVRRIKDKDTSASRKVWETLVSTLAWVNRITWKANAFADSFAITLLQNFLTRTTVRADLKEKGYDPKAVFSSFVAAAEAATRYGVAALGLTPAQAQKEAIARAEADLYQFLTDGFDVAPGVRQMDAFREAVHFMGNHAEQQGTVPKIAGKIIEVVEMVPLGLGNLLTGPIRIIANIFDANAWYMPGYSILRYGREAAAQKEGRTSGDFTGRFNLSAKSPYQLTRRRNEMIFGSLLYVTALALFVQQPDDPEERWLWVTGGYPTDEDERRVWEARGYTPYTLYVGKGGTGGKRLAIQMTRGAMEFMNMPLQAAQRSADAYTGRVTKTEATARFAYDMSSIGVPAVESVWRSIEAAKRGTDEAIEREVARRLSPLAPLSSLSRSAATAFVDGRTSKDDSDYVLGELIPATVFFNEDRLELRNALNENPFAEESSWNLLMRLGAPVGFFESRGVRDPAVAKDFREMNYSPARIETLSVFEERIKDREQELTEANNVDSVQALYSKWIERRAFYFKQIYREAPEPGENSKDLRTLEEIIRDGDKDAYRDRMAVWFSQATKLANEELGFTQPE